MTARVAMRPHESMRKDSAPQVGAKLLLDVLGQSALVVFARVREKTFEVLAHDAVERRLLGTTRSVGGRKSGQGAPTTAGPAPTSVDVVSRTLRLRTGVRDDFVVSEDGRQEDPSDARSHASNDTSSAQPPYRPC